MVYRLQIYRYLVILLTEDYFKQEQLERCLVNLAMIYIDHHILRFQDLHAVTMIRHCIL